VSVIQAARNGIEILINDSPTMVTVLREPRVDGGGGEMVPFGGYQEVAKYRCRIGRERGNLQDPKAVSSGLTTDNDDFYIVAPWFAKLLINDYLREPDGTQWKVGIVSYSKASGGVLAVKAPLTRISEPEIIDNFIITPIENSAEYKYIGNVAVEETIVPWRAE